MTSSRWHRRLRLPGFAAAARALGADALDPITHQPTLVPPTENVGFLREKASVRFYTLDAAGNRDNENPDVGAAQPFVVDDVAIGTISFEGEQAFCAADTLPASTPGVRWRLPSFLVEGQAAVVESVAVYFR